MVEANQLIDEGYVSKDEPQDAKPPFNFLTSPADKFNDIFSESSEDIGKTPLIQMDIDTGNSPPVYQHPYTLPLKHAEWVKREMAISEKAGVIV